MTKNVLIASLHRSGGTLVVRLLDGHPACSVLPFETWHTQRKATFRLRHNLLFPFSSSARKLRTCGFRVYERKLVSAYPELDWTSYRDRLLELAARTGSPSELYRRAATLYFVTFHASPLRDLLVNHCANLCLLSPWQLRRTFGDYRMVLSVRDPRAVFCSLERHRPGRATERSIPSFCDDWERSVRRYHLGDPSVISFRFEDLLGDPERVMRAVCADLGIAFDEAVLEPTFHGKRARANTSFTREPGIDASAIDSWRTQLRPPVQRAIEQRLGPLLERLGYR